MQKNRIIVISVVVEGRSKAEVAKEYGVSYRWSIPSSAVIWPAVGTRSSPDIGELLRDLTLDSTRNYQPQKPQNALPKESEL